MKKFFKILLPVVLFFNVAAINAADKKQNPNADIALDESRHDFGYIKESKGPVSHTFVFTNTGSEPIEIIDAIATCGCTRPEYPKGSIAPGKKGKVKVTYNPKGRPGAFLKSVKLQTTGKRKFVNIKIEGYVIGEDEENVGKNRAE